jgi:hypothetical protein
MKYARIVSNTVIEVFTPLEDFSIGDCFHPSIASQFIEVPNDVEPNWVKQDDGTFVAPEYPTPDIIPE